MISISVNRLFLVLSACFVLSMLKTAIAQEFIPIESELTVSGRTVKGYTYQVMSNEAQIDEAWRNYLLEVHGLPVNISSHIQEIHVMPAGIKSLEGYLISRTDQSSENKTDFLVAFVNSEYNSFVKNEVGTKRLAQNLAEHFLTDYFLQHYTNELGNFQKNRIESDLASLESAENLQISFIELDQNQVDTELKNSRSELEKLIIQFESTKDKIRFHSQSFKEFEPEYRDRWKRDRVLHRSVSKNSFTLYSNYKPEKVSALWIEYVKNNLKLEVSKTAHGLYEVSKSPLPSISDLPSDLNAIIQDYGNGSKISISACPGYEICFNDKDYPREFKQLKKFLKGFSNDLNRKLGEGGKDSNLEEDLEEIYNGILSLAGDIKGLEYKIEDLAVDSFIWANNLNEEIQKSSESSRSEMAFGELKNVVDDFLDAKRRSERTFVRWGLEKESVSENETSTVVILKNNENSKSSLAGGTSPIKEEASSNHQASADQVILKKQEISLRGNDSSDSKAEKESDQIKTREDFATNELKVNEHKEEPEETTREEVEEKKINPKPSEAELVENTETGEIESGSFENQEKRGSQTLAKKDSNNGAVNSKMNQEEKSIETVIPSAKLESEIKNEELTESKAAFKHNAEDNTSSSSIQSDLLTDRTSYYTYMVLNGDNLLDLAESHKISSDEIRQLNGLNSDVLKAGIIITLPKLDTKIDGETETEAGLVEANTKPLLQFDEENKTVALQVKQPAQEYSKKETSELVKPAEKMHSSVNDETHAESSGTENSDGRTWFYAYKIKNGDELLEIATKHKMTVLEVMQINGLEDEILKPGSVLTLKMINKPSSSS